MLDGHNFGFWRGLNFKGCEQRISLGYSVFFIWSEGLNVEDFSFIKGYTGLKD